MISPRALRLIRWFMERANFLEATCPNCNSRKDGLGKSESKTWHSSALAHYQAYICMGCGRRDR